MQKENNVYIFGSVGNYGTKILIVNERKKLLTRFSNFYLDKVLYDLEDGLNARPIFYDNAIDTEIVEEGGLLKSLWKICDRNNFGLRYDLSFVPILQGTIEITNFFLINPYRLYTKNSYIFITSENIDTNIYPIYKIGTTNGLKKRVRIDGEVEAFLTKDYKDELYKIINKKSLIVDNN